MTQRLYAFWKYDLTPHYLGGEVLKFTEKGNVEVEGYPGYVFTPVKITTYEEGIKIHTQLKELGYVYDERKKALYKEIKDKCEALIK
jgi:hypothetical protein